MASKKDFLSLTACDALCEVAPTTIKVYLRRETPIRWSLFSNIKVAMYQLIQWFQQKTKKRTTPPIREVTMVDDAERLRSIEKLWCILWCAPNLLASCEEAITDFVNDTLTIL